MHGEKAMNNSIAPKTTVRMLIALMAFFTMAAGSALARPSTSAAGSASPWLTQETVCLPQVTNLTAGQTIAVGNLTVWNDATNLYVQYNLTADCWTFGTLHLWAGTDMTLLPKNNSGTPIPGQFPYQENVNGGTTYTFTIPYYNLVVDQAAFCGAQIYVVAHAEVNCGDQHETAFGGNTAGTGSNRWFFYTMYAICCGTPPPPPEYACQTAFAKGGWVFTTDKKSNPEHLPSLGLTKNRWGWAINIPDSDGTVTFPVWAGAGLNNTAKGVNVGTLTVTRTGGSVTVSYNLTVLMEELHIYIGDLKPTTVAPGQYGYIQYFDPKVSTHTQTFPMSDTDGDGIWIIAHAIVCIPTT
jgi:hypothetical protein